MAVWYLLEKACTHVATMSTDWAARALGQGGISTPATAVNRAAAEVQAWVRPLFPLALLGWREATLQAGSGTGQATKIRELSDFTTLTPGYQNRDTSGCSAAAAVGSGGELGVAGSREWRGVGSDGESGVAGSQCEVGTLVA